MNDNFEAGFRNYPQTIGEIRADRSDKASDWTPRDALICLLRRIDSGVDVKELVVSYVSIDDDEPTTHFLAIQDRNASLGLVARVMHLLNVA